MGMGVDMDHNPFPSSLDFPHLFRCPISMDLMEDPVTISTGVTYDRKSIHRWFHNYRKRICPATMQPLHTLEMTPNHTLKRLILAWIDRSRPSSSMLHHELETLVTALAKTPFKVTTLKKIRTVLETGDDRLREDFKRLRGVEALVGVMDQILVENCDFVNFRACEEALGILHQVDDEPALQLLLNPNCIKWMSVILQRGSAEARFFTISTFQKIGKGGASYYYDHVAQDHERVEFFKSLLDIVSDEESCTKANSHALQLLIEILESSKKSRLKAIEAGAICKLIELLPDSSNSRSKCEKILHLIKLLCECAEGRLAFTEHELGIAAVSNKMINASIVATKIGVKILSLISSFCPTEKVLEDLLVCGAVERLATVAQTGGRRSTTTDRAVKILKLHGITWRRYRCLTGDVRDFLGL